MKFKENETIKLSDGSKYWIIKKLLVEDITFYYTIKLGTEPDIVVFAENNELEIVQDEEILKIISAELAKQLSI